MTRRQHARRLRLMAAVLLAVLTTACGGGEDESSTDGGAPAAESKSASAATTRDPCTLLTTAQITAASGLGVVGSQRKEPALGDSPFDTCDWRLDGSNFETLRLSVYPSKDARAYFEAGKGSEQPVAGIGMEASWDTKLSALGVIKGDFAFSVQPLIHPRDRRRPAAEALARNVLANAS